MPRDYWPFEIPYVCTTDRKGLPGPDRPQGRAVDRAEGLAGGELRRPPAGAERGQEGTRLDHPLPPLRQDPGDTDARGWRVLRAGGAGQG